MITLIALIGAATFFRFMFGSSPRFTLYEQWNMREDEPVFLFDRAPDEVRRYGQVKAGRGSLVPRLAWGAGVVLLVVLVVAVAEL